MPRILTINIDGTGYDLGQTITPTVVNATWTANATTCTVSNQAITAQSIVMLMAPTVKADFETLAKAEICSTAQAAGSITLKALGTAPASATSFKLLVLL